MHIYYSSMNIGNGFQESKLSITSSIMTSVNIDLMRKLYVILNVCHQNVQVIHKIAK